MSSLRTSELGLTLIKAFEGCRLKPYLCPAGKWTIGYGHTSAAGGMKVTAATPPLANEQAAYELLMEDIDRFEDQIERLLARDVSVNEFDALVSLAFNIGIPNFKASTLLKRVNDGSDDNAVAAQIERWNKITVKKNGKPTKVISAGLSRRRRAEAALWRNDLASVQAFASVKFPAMPQDVAQPDAVKTIAKSKTANASILGLASTAAITAKEVNEAIQPAVDPIRGTVEVVSGVATQAQTAAIAAQTATASGKQALVTTVDIWTRLGQAAPWLLLLVLMVLVFAYVWFDRRRRLHEEGV